MREPFGAVSAVGASGASLVRLRMKDGTRSARSPGPYWMTPWLHPAVAYML